jgi:hypothetical protein
MKMIKVLLSILAIIVVTQISALGQTLPTLILNRESSHTVRTTGETSIQ